MFITKRPYTIYLISLLIMVFGDLFIPNEYLELATSILLIQNMVLSILLFSDSSRGEKVFMGIIILSGILTRVSPFLYTHLFFLFALTYILYFTMVSRAIITKLLSKGNVDLETLATAFSGYILLGFLAAIVFITMDGSTIEMFKGLSPNRHFNDFLYFAYITLLTIGYGDITPTHQISQKSVIFLGILGHFYTVFVMAIVIGKFLSQSKSKT